MQPSSTLSLWQSSLLLLAGSTFALPQQASFTQASTAAAATSTGLSQASSSGACNNSPSLCSRSYGNITHLGAHDSPFVSNSSNKFTSSGNQFYTSTTQLDAGVRLLTAQIHTANSSDTSTAMRLCHTDCSLYDGGTLVDWLSEIKTWLDNNPHDVVTILLVNSISATASRLDTDFKQSGITKYSYTLSSSQSSWPTLQSMISANTRLVTFIADLPSNSGATYLLDEFTYVFENPFEVTSASNFSCTPSRPTTLGGSVETAKSSGKLFLMNHFLDEAQLFGIETPNRDAAASTNSPDTSVTGSLGAAAQQCVSTYSRNPNFVLVDWFNVGPAITTVDRLNGVQNAVSGRKNVSTEILSNSVSASAANVVGSKSGSALALLVGLAVAVAGWL